MRFIAIVALAWVPGLHAHDLITAESAARYLQEADTWGSAGQHADAHYRLGMMRDEIRVLLNQDLAAHGKVQGLPSNYLIEELARRGTPLPKGKRGFVFDPVHFEKALKLAPHGAFAADAGFRLLQGSFYDSFEQDPLDWRSEGRPLPSQIALAEELLARHAGHPAREEIEFIAAILYTRAARQPELSSGYADKARRALDGFAARYPASLRAAAVPVLREAVNIAR
jgi:hypothetical protein